MEEIQEPTLEALHKQLAINSNVMNQYILAIKLIGKGIDITGLEAAHGENVKILSKLLEKPKDS